MKKILVASISIFLCMILLFGFTPIQSSGQNNLISVGNVQIPEGQITNVPILITDAVNISSIKVNLSYNPAIVNVTDATLGDFTSVYKFDLSNAENGYIEIYVIKIPGGLSGNKTVANVQLTAMGGVHDTSDLNISIIALKDDTGDEVIDRSTKNGSIIIVSFISEVSKTVIFTDDSSGGNDAQIVNHEWKFYSEDDTLLDCVHTKNVTYTFPVYGKYCVELIVTNECGNENSTKLKCIDTGCPMPIADFTHTAFAC